MNQRAQSVSESNWIVLWGPPLSETALVIPKAACIWILGEGHSASLRSVGSACVHWRASWLRWVGCEQVGQSSHGRDGHAPFSCGFKV